MFKLYYQTSSGDNTLGIKSSLDGVLSNLIHIYEENSKKIFGVIIEFPARGFGEKIEEFSNKIEVPIYKYSYNSMLCIPINKTLTMPVLFKYLFKYTSDKERITEYKCWLQQINKSCIFLEKSLTPVYNVLAPNTDKLLQYKDHTYKPKDVNCLNCLFSNKENNDNEYFIL